MSEIKPCIMCMDGWNTWECSKNNVCLLCSKPSKFGLLQANFYGSTMEILTGKPFSGHDIPMIVALVKLARSPRPNTSAKGAG